MTDTFEGYVAARQRSLQRAAWLLTGDVHGAQDLVQCALLKVWPRWDRIRSGDPDAYVRQAIFRTYVATRRRRWAQEVPTATVPEQSEASSVDLTDARDELLHALGTLKARQRAVIVLRYFEELSEAETAAVLQLPLGTVKSDAHRAIARLRLLLDRVAAEGRS